MKMEKRTNIQSRPAVTIPGQNESSTIATFLNGSNILLQNLTRNRIAENLDITIQNFHILNLKVRQFKIF